MNRLGLYLLRPFYVIKYNKTSFFVWILCTFLGGNSGIISNLIIRHYSYKVSVLDSISYDLYSGTFYVFVMAMLASSFGTVLIDFWTRENNDFRQPKVIWAILTFFICAFNCIFYTSVRDNELYLNAL